jgi:hypothetical protein
MNSILQAFSQDENVEVRKILAASLHDVNEYISKFLRLQKSWANHP